MPVAGTFDPLNITRRGYRRPWFGQVCRHAGAVFVSHILRDRSVMNQYVTALDSNPPGPAAP
jgi:hypothetical protein